MAKKVLIIDDETDITKVLYYRLRAKGYEAWSAATGEEGAAVAAAQMPSVIILDYHLPDMAASEVIRMVRAVGGLRETPIILISASVENMEEKVRECGAAAYFTKPIDSEALMKKIDMCS